MTDQYDIDSPAARFKPQLAVGLDIDRVDRYAGYIMQPKLDGWRAIVIKRGDSVQIFTRTMKPLHDKLPHLVEEFRTYTEDFILDGEVGYESELSEDAGVPIINFNPTARVLGSGTQVAIQKQHENYLVSGDQIKFFAFDLLAAAPVGSRLEWAGGDLYVNRRLWLEQFALGHFDLDRDIVQEVPFSRTWNEPTYRDYVDCGGEGVVLKNPNARYVIGKRPANNWYKVKKFQTLDVVITGFTDGQGKYEGQIGAIIFKDPTGRVGRCSGMDDATRLGLSAAVHSEIVGSVIEIRHWGHSGQGEEGYRFPQFVRFRPDKGVS